MTSDDMSQDQASVPGDPKRRAMGYILYTASGLIICTNTLVAAALLRLLLRRRSSQSWCFVLNLALADIFVGVGITGLATEDLAWVAQNASAAPHPTNSTPHTAAAAAAAAAAGRARCLLRMAFVSSPCTASIMSMFLISLDRYAAIKRPLHYSVLSGRWTAAGSLLALWVTALVTGFLPVMVKQLQARTPFDGFCAFFSVIHDIGIIVLYCALFFPVLSVFTYMYLDILKIAYSHQRKISQVRRASSRSAASDQAHHRYLHRPQQQQQQHLRSSDFSHLKALRTVAVLVGCFLVLWCPFFVVCIVHIVCKSCRLKYVLENYLWLLGLSNSLINPLVYAFWQREVRLQLVSMFSCSPGRRPRSRAAPRATERRSPPAPQLQTGGGSRGETPSPSLLLPDTPYGTGAVPLSDTTSL